MKECAHRTPDDLGIPEVNGPRHGHDRGRTERGGRPKDGSDVAGILYGIEHDQAGSLTEFEIVEPASGNLGDGEHALWGVGLGGAGELAVVHLDELGAVTTSEIEERRPALSARELWGDEQAAYGEGRSEQLLDGPHALGDEEALTLAGAPTLEVAG